MVLLTRILKGEKGKEGLSICFKIHFQGTMYNLFSAKGIVSQKKFENLCCNMIKRKKQEVLAY